MEKKLHYTVSDYLENDDFIDLSKYRKIGVYVVRRIPVEWW